MLLKASLACFKHVDFPKNVHSKLWYENQYANEYLLTKTSYGADAVTFHLIFMTGPSKVL